MPTITKIVHKSDRGRYWIYVDGEYCTSIRDRTFPELNLNVGDNIESCDKLKERESYFWKQKYGQDSWDAEKIRLEKVGKLLTDNEPRVMVKTVGFGADTNQFIPKHADESGKPDLEVGLKDAPDKVLLQIEVTGTKVMRGTGYWVRPDKLAYAKNNPGQDVWTILHFAEPEEKFIFIKPDTGKEYSRVEKVIGAATEYYVEFFDQSEEVMTQEEFFLHLNERISAMST